MNFPWKCERVFAYSQSHWVSWDGWDLTQSCLSWNCFLSHNKNHIHFGNCLLLVQPPAPPPPHNSHLRMGFPHPHDHVLAHWEAASDGNDPLLWWTPIHCILGFHRIHFRSPRTTRLGILKGQESRLLSKAVAVKLAFGLHVVLCT